MAKGRRYGTERLLAAPAHFGGGAHSGRAADLPDLAEDDVWPAFYAASHDDSFFAAGAEGDDDDRRPRTGRSWAHRHVGGRSLAFEDTCRGAAVAAQPPHRERRHRVAASSGPVDVPAWPRSLQAGSGGAPAQWEEEEEEEEDAAAGDGEWLPPHEYLARAHGRSMATSVLEGVGRTLKGRDMSRVRDAVWSQTGFFG